MEEEKESWSEPIKKFWKKNVDFIDSLISNIEDGVTNYIKWRKIIWLDKSWDHDYMFKIWKFKLEQMENYFRYRGISTEADKDANNIKRCIELLDRILKDDYYSEIAFKDYYAKYGNEIDLVLNGGKIQSSRDPVQQKEFKSAIELEEFLRDKDYDELFQILRKECRAWWD